MKKAISTLGLLALLGSTAFEMNTSTLRLQHCYTGLMRWPLRSTRRSSATRKEYGRLPAFHHPQ